MLLGQMLVAEPCVWVCVQCVQIVYIRYTQSMLLLTRSSKFVLGSDRPSVVILKYSEKFEDIKEGCPQDL